MGEDEQELYSSSLFAQYACMKLSAHRRIFLFVRLLKKKKKSKKLVTVKCNLPHFAANICFMTPCLLGPVFIVWFLYIKLPLHLVH